MIRHTQIVLLIFLFAINNAKYVTAQQPNLDSLYAVWQDQTQPDSIRVKAYTDYIWDGFIYSSPDSAELMVENLHSFSKENNYAQAATKGFDIKSVINFRRGNYSLALEYNQQSLNISEELDDKKGIANSLYNFGNIYRVQGNNALALDYYIQSLEINKKLGDKTGIANNLKVIGLIYRYYENYPLALEYNQQALKIAEELGDISVIGSSLMNIGRIYEAQGNYPLALEYYEQSIKIAKELGYKPGITTGLTNIGNIYYHQENYVLALEYHEQSLTIAQEMGDKKRISKNLSNLGVIYAAQGNNSRAVDFCKKGLALGEEIKLLWSQKPACQCLYDAYKAMGNDIEALVYLEKIQVIDDSLNAEETVKTLQQMEFERQFIEDSLQHEEEKLKIELTHQLELIVKNRVKNIFIISGLIILFIAVGLWARMRFVRKANARLEVERDRAEKSEQFKHQFLANMSHEIRTPMNAIKGMSDILLRRKPKTDQLKYIKGIKESSDSLLVIINDILDLSKIEVGKIDFEQIPFSIPEIIKNTEMIMHFKAEEKGLELNLDMPENVPQVIGDPTRLRQVIINLVGNAIKFTEKGTVTISAKIEAQESDNKVNAHFTVSDTGIGINKNQLDKVFNSFEQAYAETSRKYGGTGLGLSISKKLVELQQGKIWAESKPGLGSQFHFVIPYPINQEREKIEDEPAVSTTENLTNHLKGISILLVEDNAFNILVAQEELEDAIQDAKVIVAENGALAVEQINQNDFDVVLMDVQMPVMNGYEATKAIRDLDNEKSKTPILAMTANVMQEEVELCFKAGMNDFIGKPFETDELIQKIHGLVKENV